MTHFHLFTAVAAAAGVGLFVSSSAAVASPAANPNQGSFEGTVAMHVTTDRSQGPQNVRVAIQGNRMRYDLPASASHQKQPVEAIVDMARHQIFLVMPAQRTYAVLDVNQIPPESKQATERRVADASAHWTASRTGTTKTFAGHTCDQWQARNTANGDRIDACLARGVRVDFDALLPSSMLPASWSDKLRNGELPLAATVYDSSGKITFQEQVTSVDRGPVPASNFEPPADYKRVDLPMSAFGTLLPGTK